jgi:hypothetical protein
MRGTTSGLIGWADVVTRTCGPDPACCRSILWEGLQRSLSHNIAQLLSCHNTGWERCTSSTGSIEATRLEEMPSSLENQACVKSSLLFLDGPCRHCIARANESFNCTPAMRTSTASIYSCAGKGTLECGQYRTCRSEDVAACGDSCMRVSCRLDIPMSAMFAGGFQMSSF